jgi:peptidoglycan/xylan/chitin deacetylase (PgdA/CDA1 family)
MSGKPLMSLSLDLDNKWSYLKTHGSDKWKGFPSYLDLVVPRILSFLSDRDIHITFFIVGQDAALQKNHDALRQISDAGHDIGNHSFNHEPWLHLYSKEEIHAELELAEVAIEEATSRKVSSFRGPGFSISTAVLNALNERGYAYDATAFPNILNPLARAYFFAKSDLSKEERKRRAGLFGSFADALRPVKPYYWELESTSLFEFPVTTMPIFKTPIHFSYLIYLATFSKTIARLYLRFVIALCKLTNTEPSLLLHPLDFLGADDDDDLRFFPGMNIPSQEKIALMSEFFELLTKSFNPITLADHAARYQQGDRKLRSYEPTFSR